MTRPSKRALEREIEDLRAGGEDVLDCSVIWCTGDDGSVTGRFGPDGFDGDVTAADLPDGVDVDDLQLVADFSGGDGD